MAATAFLLNVYVVLLPVDHLELLGVNELLLHSTVDQLARLVEPAPVLDLLNQLGAECLQFSNSGHILLDLYLELLQQLLLQVVVLLENVVMITFA